MTRAAVCQACGLGLREGARFCDGCGAAVAADPTLAEFKQVTILFARSGQIIERSGGTLNSFTGDGTIALFGAPVALEDHAFRACVAAWDLQQAAEQLGAEVLRRDRAEARSRLKRPHTKTAEAAGFEALVQIAR